MDRDSLGRRSPPQFIHIGLAKTGTTTLQRTVFSRHSHILYLGKVHSPDARLLAVMREVARKPPRRLPGGWIRDIAVPEVTRAIEAGADGKRAVVFSEEDLTSHRFVDPAVSAARMHALLPDAGVLVVLRDPVEWLQSMYYFRLSLRFPETLDGFDSWVASTLDRGPRGTDVGQLRVAETLDAYADLFGAERVNILFHEDMRSDGARFVADLAADLGIDRDETLELYRTGQAEGFAKLRITEARCEFLYAFRLVREGRFADYVELLEEMIARLPDRARAEAEALLPTNLAKPQDQLAAQLKAVSRLLDRRVAGLDHGARASAELSPETRRVVSEVVAPGLSRIEERWGVDARRYLATG